MRPFWSAGPAGRRFPLIGGAAPRAASLSRALPAARAAPAAALARQRGPSWAPFFGPPFPSRPFDSCTSCGLGRSLLPTPLSCLLECGLLCLPPQVWPPLQSCLNRDSIWPLPPVCLSGSFARLLRATAPFSLCLSALRFYLFCGPAPRACKTLAETLDISFSLPLPAFSYFFFLSLFHGRWDRKIANDHIS